MISPCSSSAAQWWRNVLSENNELSANVSQPLRCNKKLQKVVHGTRFSREAKQWVLEYTHGGKAKFEFSIQLRWVSNLNTDGLLSAYDDYIIVKATVCVVGKKSYKTLEFNTVRRSDTVTKHFTYLSIWLLFRRGSSRFYLEKMMGNVETLAFLGSPLSVS